MLNRMWHRLSRHGLVGTLGYVFGAVLVERLGFSVRCVYHGAPEPSPVGTAGYDIAVLNSMRDLSHEDRAGLLEHGGHALLKLFGENFSNGNICVVTRIDGEIACACWLARTDGFSSAHPGPRTLIEQCFTVHQHRGKSLYPLTLRHTRYWANQFSGCEDLLIETSVFNKSSIRGILKAGFQRIGTAIVIGEGWGFPRWWTAKRYFFAKK